MPNALRHDNHRTSEQQRAYDALFGDGGLPSWERTLEQAIPENRADVLQTALIELHRLAEKAGVNHTEISDWGFGVGKLYDIGGDADGLQAIIAEARGIARYIPSVAAGCGSST